MKPPRTPRPGGRPFGDRPNTQTPHNPRPSAGHAPRGAESAPRAPDRGRNAPPDRTGGPRPKSGFGSKPGRSAERPDQRPDQRPALAAPAPSLNTRPALSLPHATSTSAASASPHAALPPRGPRPPHGTPRTMAEAAPRGTLWLYGHHAVAAALANPQRRLRRLLLTEEAEATLATRLAPPWSLTPEPVTRPRLDQLLGHDVVHQGVALLADPLPAPMLAQALERAGPVLVLDQISDPRNVGAILRSAAAFGVAAVIVQDRNAPEETGALAKAASGALELVPLLRAVNLARTLVALKAANCWVVGLAAANAALSGPALSGRRVALVLGAEGAGLRRLTQETCDELAGLPMPGGMESLNVSAAAAIALYEISRPKP